MKIGTLLTYVPLSDLLFSRSEIEQYNKMSWKCAILQVINAAYLLTSAYMIWKTAGVLCNTDSPIVVVLSESMYPGFDRGDILLLSNWKKTVFCGDICVFQVVEKEIPIVHRVIDRYHKGKNGSELRVMTKGDNNNSNDNFLYRKSGQMYLTTKNIQSLVFVSLFPYLGMLTIWANRWAWVKYAIMGFLFVSILFEQDETTTSKKAKAKTATESAAVCNPKSNLKTDPKAGATSKKK
ncbi:signal peptidase, endoplasmic reticulum-type [Nematocida displodere]|uniref:Signal peptidase complex catalytic subunit SEC11 n=1 Tax=Nematocida displodere TaxID=1805483 RepID=A0A177ECP7_9MICR|nr:signal peptidase, endoplasmic reticulum-type [Nematocida displodere]